MSVPFNAIHYLEIVTPDAQAVRDLYEKCYGLDFKPMDPALGNAYVSKFPNGSICGIRCPMHSSEEPIVRTYLLVESLVTSIQKAAELGAKILLEHMELPGYGIIAIYELGGIQHGIWQVS